MNLAELLSLAIFAVFAENFVLVQFLGVDSLLGASKKMTTALDMGIAVTVVMALSSLLNWAVNAFLLIPLGLDGFLQTVVFILIIAALVQLVELLLKKTTPALYTALGTYLPLITTNCAVLGVALLNTQKGHGALMSTAYGVFGGLGFTLVIILFASARERLEFAECPKAFEGFPIALVTAGLLAMAFMGFSGLNLS